MSPKLFPREENRVERTLPKTPNRVWRVITRNIDELEALYVADTAEEAASGSAHMIGQIRRDQIFETTACDEMLPARNPNGE